jgi:hypothetical protein
MVEFEGVQALDVFEPEGMELYALAEMRAQSPLRQFDFANNSESERKILRVIVRGFRVRLNDSGAEILDG